MTKMITNFCVRSEARSKSLPPDIKLALPPLSQFLHQRVSGEPQQDLCKGKLFLLALLNCWKAFWDYDNAVACEVETFADCVCAVLLMKAR